MKIMLRDKVLAAVVFLVLVAAFLVPAYVERRIADSELTIACLSARANVDQLHALKAVANELGIPANFPIPEVPLECNGA